MFQNLTGKLSDIFSNLRRKGALTEADIDAVMREVRIALLEADVALPVVKDFIAGLKQKALGAEIIASVSPAQMVVKLTHDHLKELLGTDTAKLNLNTQPPAVILMCGLQGSGKTTSTGKLAYFLKHKQGKKVMVASLDIYRPAAQEQLRQVAERAGVLSLPFTPNLTHPVYGGGKGGALSTTTEASVNAETSPPLPPPQAGGVGNSAPQAGGVRNSEPQAAGVKESPLEITRRALQAAKLEGADVLLLDTAGRLHVDAELMDELIAVKKLANPIETLLVADSLTGQDAVNIAKSFHDAVNVTGIILTRVDGDGRGGAALSMRHVTGQPIKFLGLGEKLEAFEEFHPDRIASRILDMGDVVSLVEKAAEMVTQDEAEQMAKNFAKGQFTLDDMLDQLRKMKKMGGIGSMLGMLPGINKIRDQIDESKLDGKMFDRQEAIILSMTKKERQFPKLLNASRRMRIAKGSGTTVQEVNKILKQHQQMETMMKKMKKMGKTGMMRGGMQQMLKQMGM